MPKTTSFWPPVQRLQRGAGRFELDAPARYWAPELPQLGRRLQKLLHRFQLEATPASAANEATIQLEIRPDVAPRRYRLTIDERAISISGADAEALGYGVTTLGQWARLHEHPPRRGLALPAVVIDDAPDLAVRGLMLDISRDKVPSMQTLRDLVDILCDFKLNQLQLYTEHTFAYRGHEQVWCDASPLMPSEIRELDAYCRDHEIELVPNQNSFAHFHRWLKHERYRPLSECPDGIDHPFSPTREPFSLCPTDERVFALLSDLYGQLLPCFSSARFNVGLDEAFDLGCCRSAAAAAARGKAALFADYLDRIATLAAEHGRSVQYWADMVLAENVPLERLPKDGSALIWGYEADHPFAAQAERLANANLSFYLCPGTSSWNSFVGRSTNALVNLSQAAVAARDHRADGYLITDWGDNGHHQPLSVSFLPIVAGAGFAWRTDAAAALDREAIRAAVDRYLLDANPELGAASLLERLADAHLLAGATPKNSSAPFNLVVRPQWPLDHAAYRGLTSSGLQRCSDEVADCCSSLARIAETLRDGQLLCDELTLAGAWVQLGCAVGRARLGHESAFSCHAGTEFAFSCHAGTEFAFSCHAGTEFAFSCHAGTEFAFSCHAGTEFAFSCHAGTEFAFSCHAGTEFAFSCHAGAFSCHAGTEFAFSCHAGTEFAFSCHAGTEFAFSCHAGTEFAFSCHAGTEFAFSCHAGTEFAFSCHAGTEFAFSCHAGTEFAFSCHAGTEFAFSCHAGTEFAFSCHAGTEFAFSCHAGTEFAFSCHAGTEFAFSCHAGTEFAFSCHAGTEFAFSCHAGTEFAFSCHAGTEFAFSCHAGTEFAFSCHAGTEFAFSCHAGTEFAFSCHAGTEFAFSCHAGTEFAFSCHAGTEFAFSCHAGTEFAFSCHAGTEFAFSCHAGTEFAFSCHAGTEFAFSCHAGTEFAFSCHAGTEFAFSCHAGTEFAFSCHAGTEFAFSCHAGTEFAFSCHAGTEFAFSCHAGTEFAFSCHAGTEFAFSCHAGTEFAFSCHAGTESKRALRRKLAELVARQSELWSRRNRPGGRRDALARFEPLFRLVSEAVS
jgi:hexosaminidase